MTQPELPVERIERLIYVLGHTYRLIGKGEMLGAEAQAVRLEVHEAIELLEAARSSWEAFAEHLYWCSTCAEDGVPNCFEGRDYSAAARAANKAVGYAN